MTKPSKTPEELADLVRTYVKKHYFVPLTGAQFIKINPIQRTADGTNWYIAHSGEGGGHYDALDEAQAELTKLYDLRPVD